MRASAFRDRWKLHIITVISSEILVPALRGIELYALEPHLCRPGKPLGGEKLLLRRVRPSRGTQRTPALFVVYPGDEPLPEPPQTRRRKTVHHAKPRPRKRLLVGYELRPAKLDLQNIVRNAYHVEDQLCTPAQRPCGDKREDVYRPPWGGYRSPCRRRTAYRRASRTQTDSAGRSPPTGVRSSREAPVQAP